MRTLPTLGLMAALALVPLSSAHEAHGHATEVPGLGGRTGYVYTSSSLENTFDRVIVDGCVPSEEDTCLILPVVEFWAETNGDESSGEPAGVPFYDIVEFALQVAPFECPELVCEIIEDDASHLQRQGDDPDTQCEGTETLMGLDGSVELAAWLVLGTSC